ncbi:hypothetical protein E2P81_ATG06936 [Venturia nashicola]|nr:hypothetical protein E2P81_ATG06936 [Venturia nashicola]
MEKGVAEVAGHEMFRESLLPRHTIRCLAEELDIGIRSIRLLAFRHRRRTAGSHETFRMQRRRCSRISRVKTQRLTARTGWQDCCGPLLHVSRQYTDIFSRHGMALQNEGE